MNPVLHATLAIARRDFTQTVMSRTFLLFLVAPLFPLMFGLVLGGIGSGGTRPGAGVTVVAHGPEAAVTRLLAIDARNAQALRAPPVRLMRGPAMGADHQDATLDLSVTPAVLGGDRATVDRARPYVLLLLRQAAADSALSSAGLAPPEPELRASVRPRAADAPADRSAFAQIAVTVLFVATLMLAGMLLSNFVEEKGNKVIEILVAAAPVPAIFTGKLFAMLGSSLIGLAVWGGTALVALLTLAPGGLPDPPAVGWPLFAVLGFFYFAMNYLLVGALLLGVGAQAASVRQVQTLSLPVTFAQLLLYAFASGAVNDIDRPLALAAAIFPYSSPLAMIARASQSAAWWPHVAGLAWQALWVAITILVASRLFRRGVLKSGSRRRRPPRATTGRPAAR
jgi:ABC-2 type transport system permease protein